ncbi:MAG: SGNH/GDSL hydrolase family protein [Polyangiaceae bacterium]
MPTPRLKLMSALSAAWMLFACSSEGEGARPTGSTTPDAQSDADARQDADSSADAAQDADAGSDAGADARFTRYPPEQRSPVTASVIARAKSILAANPSRSTDVFMKVGASGTVSKNLLYCFAGPSQPAYQLDLDGRDALLPTLDAFRAGDAAGSTPFDRPTLAAKVGMSAGWALAGSPSPLQQEVQATNPAFAFVNYGTNDMGQGVTFASALFNFAENLARILDELEGEGIVPLVTGLNPRTDSTNSAQWVPTYDALTRGMAEARQLPYLSLYYAAKDLPAQGMIADGIHGNVYSPAGAQPCVFTAAGLAYNYNVRNLLSLELLRRIHDGAVLAHAPAEQPGAVLQGTGTATDPWRIDRFPFSHAADTSMSSARNIDSYPGCAASQNESGPEWVYALHLDAETRLRILVVDRGNVDVDLHLTQGEPKGASCVARHDRLIQGTFPSGDYSLVVDTFATSTEERAGAYALVVLPCAAGDPDCG